MYGSTRSQSLAEILRPSLRSGLSSAGRGPCGPSPPLLSLQAAPTLLRSEAGINYAHEAS
jgi:hypothetical protein